MIKSAFIAPCNDCEDIKPKSKVVNIEGEVVCNIFCDHMGVCFEYKQALRQKRLREEYEGMMEDEE